MFFCDIKNYFITNNVFEKVLKYTDDRIADQKQEEMFQCFYMHLNVGHREKRKSVLGKKINFLTAVTGYRVSENLKQYITVYESIFVNPKIKSCHYLYSRIRQYMRDQEEIIAANIYRYEAQVSLVYPQISPIDICP